MLSNYTRVDTPGTGEREREPIGVEGTGVGLGIYRRVTGSESA